jgi:hypothetical protein
VELIEGWAKDGPSIQKPREFEHVRRIHSAIEHNHPGAYHMYRFVHAFPDGCVYNQVIGGKDIREAFEKFADIYWSPNDPPGALAVFQDHAVVALVLFAKDKKSGVLLPYLRELEA